METIYEGHVYRLCAINILPTLADLIKKWGYDGNIYRGICHVPSYDVMMFFRTREHGYYVPVRDTY